MVFGFLPSRVIWAAALMVAAMLALVPSPASAHAGHSHAGHSHAGQPQARAATVHQQTPPATAAVKGKSVQMVSAAVTLPVPSDEATRCDGVGCCASGPCTGCHGAMLAAAPFQPPARAPGLIPARDVRPPGGADVDRLKRPPKFFA